MSVTKDTVIFTNQGIIPISLLNKTDNNLISYDENINYNILSDNIVKTKKLIQSIITLDIIEIQTQNKYILKGTEKHKIKILQDEKLTWKELKNLQINDLAAIQLNYNIDSINDIITQNDINKLLLEEINYIEEIDRVLESSKDIQKYFLQHYFNKYMYLIDDTIQIINNNINILKQIQILLLTFNICSKINLNTLYIDSKYWNNFQNNIGIIDEVKRIYLSNFVQSELINDKYIYLPIEQINYCEPEITYTLELNNCDSYIGNGFINQC